MIVDVQVGDVVALKKGHPCGANEWTVRRIGADIGLICRGCGRRVMLTRGDFNRRWKRTLSREGGADEPASEPED
jgi:hypothetical protein